MPRFEMDPDTWAVLSSLLDEALDLPPLERARWVEDLSAEHQALKPRLRDLLAHAQDPGAGSFLSTLPKLDTVPIDTTSGGRTSSGRVGEDVGPYRLVRQLAEGGMGTVWLAERPDGLIPRPVALKLPRGEWLRTGLADRMARERRILAALNHPNIARLYDAGVTAEGQPYLALEYVEGDPIDDYARRERLGIRARLALFRQVLGAVAHAHAKLVVHRDLKPSNILVTAEGQVRLLDFGIAALLDQGQAPQTELTQVAGQALTLGYASPEQVLGEPVGVGSDVYSLGVVLYELVTESRPYRIVRESRGALEEAILSAEPARPSAATADPRSRKELRGDIDRVVLKALKKEPEERYATVDAFAEDIGRYLEGRPVLAQPDTRSYRLRRFVGRNKLAVAAALAINAAILLGAGAALWQARVALAEKRRAEEVTEFIASIFKDADPYEGSGQAPSALDLLRQAKDKIDRNLAGAPELRIELLSLVASSLLNLQDYKTAETVVNELVEQATRTLGPTHPQTLRARALGLQVVRSHGRTREMRVQIQQLLPELRKRADALPGELVTVLENQAHLAIDEGKYDEAEAAASEAVTLARVTLGERDPETLAVSMLLALAYQFGGKPRLALPAAERAFRVALDVYRGDSRHARVIEGRAVLGRALHDAGEYERGIEELTRALDDASAVFGTTSMMVGFFAGNLAKDQIEAGDIAPALQNIERSLRVLDGQVDRDSYTYGAALHTRGAALLAARRIGEALPVLTTSQATLEHALGPSHERTYAAQLDLGLALGYAGKADQARQAVSAVVEARRAGRKASIWAALSALGILERLDGNYDEALRMQGDALRSIPDDPKAKRVRMPVLTEIGLGHLERGGYDEAAASLGEALALLAASQRSVTPQRADALIGLGRARMGQGRALEALPLLEEADRFWRASDAHNRWAGEAALWLGRCYSSLGRGREARRALSRARTILSRSPIPTDGRLLQLARRG